MPEVPLQQSAAATPRAGLQLGHLPALHRTARSHGGLVTDQPATEADQDRGACRPSRPHHHLPTARRSRQRPDGARYPRRHPPPSSANAMRMTATNAQTERKWQDRSVRCAEKRRRRARTRWLRGPIHPVPAARPTAEAVPGGTCLSCGQNQTTFASNATLLRECRIRTTLWGVTGCNPVRRGDGKRQRRLQAGEDVRPSIAC